MSKSIHIKSIKVITLLVVAFVFFSSSLQAQNTKGDKPASTQKPFLRIPKFKSKSKGGDRANTQDLTGRRKIRARYKSGAERAAQATKRPPYVNRNPSNDRAYVPEGGHKLKIRSNTKQASRNNVYPSNGPYVNNPSKTPKDNQHRFSRGREKVRIKSRTAQASRNNVYPNHGQFVNNPSKYPKTNQKAYSNRRILSRIASLSTKREPSGRKKIISSRTASSSFITRGRKNVYWGKFRKGEKPITTDISGRTIRAKNFHSPGLGVIPSHDVYKRKNKKPGDRPYGVSGGYVSIPKVTQPWRGDVSGHAIRSRPPKVSQTAGKMFEPRRLSKSNKKERAARPMRTVWLVKHTRSGKISNQSIPGKAPGLGALFIEKSLGKFRGGKKPKVYGASRNKSFNNNGQPILATQPGLGGRFVDFYQGFTKTRKPLKGGGSVSGRSRNNGGISIGAKEPGIGGRFVDTYTGNFKSRRQPKGGGSITGKPRNNGGQAIDVKGPGIGGRFLDTYTGSLRSGRPLKGGGSISGKLWNNSNQPIIVKSPVGIQSRYVDTYKGFLKGKKSFNTDGSDYAGNKRIWRQPKGGGSISGKLWNNSNHPLAGKAPVGSIQAKYVDIYKGYYKAQKPLKGGGSVSGKLWNNKEQSIQGKSVSVQGMKIGGYSGDIKARKPEKGGGSISGKLWNNKEHPIQGKSVSPAALIVGAYPGDHKVRRSEKYITNPNSKEKALKKMRPDKSTYLVNDLIIKTKAREYEHNKLSAKAALKGESTGKNSLRAIEYSNKIKVLWTKTFEPNKPLAGRVPMQKYVHAPNSKKGALRVLAPGRAYGRIKDLQVNVKMTKPHGNNLHPDSKFANSYRDNVKHERTFLMSLKLKWAKLFKKNDTQPAAVKGKIRRPRYDPKERDLWKDLYD